MEGLRSRGCSQEGLVWERNREGKAPGRKRRRTKKVGKKGKTLRNIGSVSPPNNINVQRKPKKKREGKVANALKLTSKKRIKAPKNAAIPKMCERQNKDGGKE